MPYAVNDGKESLSLSLMAFKGQLPIDQTAVRNLNVLSTSSSRRLVCEVKARGFTTVTVNTNLTSEDRRAFDHIRISELPPPIPALSVHPRYLNSNCHVSTSTPRPYKARTLHQTTSCTVRPSTLWLFSLIAWTPAVLNPRSSVRKCEAGISSRAVSVGAHLAMSTRSSISNHLSGLTDASVVP